MAAIAPTDPLVETRIQRSFAKQGLMRTLGANIVRISPGAVEIALPASASISQQHGFIHAGAIAAIADAAAGYAALSLMPARMGVLTTEFKINLLSPANGERILARGRVVRAGRTLTVAQTEVVALAAEEEKLVALLTATLMAIEDREGISDQCGSTICERYFPVSRRWRMPDVSIATPCGAVPLRTGARGRSG